MFLKPPGTLFKSEEMLKTISGSRHIIPMTESSRTFCHNSCNWCQREQLRNNATINTVVQHFSAWDKTLEALLDLFKRPFVPPSSIQ